MGLRAKLGLYVIGFVGVVLSIIGFSSLRTERRTYLEEVERRNITLLQAFAIPCSIALANTDISTLDNYVEQFSKEAEVLDLAYLAVLDHEGRVKAHTSEKEYGTVYDDPFTKRAMLDEEPIVERGEAEDGTAILKIGVPLMAGLRWGTVEAGFHLHQVEQALAERRAHLLRTFGLVLVGSALVAYFVLSLLVLRPVVRMSLMARRFGEGELSARVVTSSRDEMGKLAAQLNGMAEQIQRYTSSLEELVDERTRELAESNDKLVSANAQLERLARTDGLTGLYNRRHFMEQLQFEIRRGTRVKNQFAVIMLDVDYFKRYNDQNGHTAGDELLQQLASLLKQNLRATDLVARYGGEEFIVLLLDTGPEDGYATARKLQQGVAAHPFAHREKQPDGRVSVSVGVAFYPQDSVEGRTLIEYADQCLYASKQGGRNRVTRWAELAKTGVA
jgi:diguanylate cyclase (GGDEF)-like protein